MSKVKQLAERNLHWTEFRKQTTAKGLVSDTSMGWAQTDGTLNSGDTYASGDEVLNYDRTMVLLYDENGNVKMQDDGVTPQYTYRFHEKGVQLGGGRKEAIAMLQALQKQGIESSTDNNAAAQQLLADAQGVV